MERKFPDLELLPSSRIARAIGMHPDTFRRKIERGDGPPCVMFGGSRLFRLATVRRWIAEQESRSTATQPPKDLK